VNAPTLADLHLHSDCSDGVLGPTALVGLAAGRGVTLLALTDHDTLGGCAEAATAAAAAGIRCVAGVEVSALWRGQSVHVLGIGVARPDDALHALLAGIRAQRHERLREIGARLERRSRIPARELAERVCASAAVATRMHLARGLVAAGHATDIKGVFDKLLGHGRDGHVPERWPPLAEVVARLAASGAQVVLAHAQRYRLSGGALRALVAEFRAAGGHGLEVGVAGIAQHDLDRLATLARTNGLAGSCGSDFHDPALPWNPPGRFAKLPADIEPLADRL
jgi:predicted metal-dependent phosphoesterase TrpH